MAVRVKKRREIMNLPAFWCCFGNSLAERAGKAKPGWWGAGGPVRWPGAVAPCGGPFGAIEAESATIAGILVELEADPVDFETVELPDPGDLENMPDAATAPAEPDRGPVGEIDLDAIQVPPAPTD